MTANINNFIEKDRAIGSKQAEGERIKPQYVSKHYQFHLGSVFLCNPYLTTFNPINA